MPNRKAQITEIFREFSDMFDNGTPSIKLSPDEQDVYVPHPISPDAHDYGTRLKEDAGYIALQEKINKSGDRISYVYRYFSPEYECLTYKGGSGGGDHCDVFNFHYDGYEDNIPHEPHINVLFPSIRYMSKKITLKDFLIFIREHFFENREGLLHKKVFNIWDNRF